jgi:uncharacterized cupredoxin-like copper-binding protein
MRVLLALLAASLPPLLAATPTPAAPAANPTRVAVTITDAQLQLPQVPVRVGTVVFRIANHAKVARDFRIAGRRTPRIAPGATATLTVSVAKTGLALLSSSGPPGSAPLRGVLTFIDPCTNQATTAVTVQMSEAPPVLSRTSIPCGTVTFTVTNAGTVVHTFHVDAAVGGDGPRLQPGQTASFTVRLTTKGKVFYRCLEPDHDEMYGETGWITVG